MTQTSPQPDDLQEFFDLVFSWDGAEASTFKSIHYTFIGKDNETAFAGVAAQTKQELMAQARFYIGKGRDVYVCLGSQNVAEPGKKKWLRANKHASNIRSHKTLYVDVDVGKGDEKSYATIDEAYVAVDQFCNDAGLPRPSLRVQSGGGLHCYWIMEHAIPKVEWQPLAEALKAALLTHKLKCDAMCTADVSRILRVPTSYNWKLKDQPRPVVMYDPEQVYSKATLEAALAPYRGMTIKTPSVPRIPATVHQTTFNKNFSDGVAEAQALQVDLFHIADAGCGVIADAIDTAGAAHPEPLWSLLMLAATWDLTEIPTAIQMSDGYPGYNEDETRAKLLSKVLARKQNPRLGWPSCQQFHDTGIPAQAICKACPHWGKIASPLHLYKAHVPTVEEKSLHLPEGYWLDEANCLYTRMLDKKGEEHELRLFDYPLIDGGIIDGGEQTLVMDIFMGFKNRRITIPAGKMAKDGELFNTLFEQSVALRPTQEKYIRSFIVSWLRTLQTITHKRVRPTSLGWDKETFSYGAHAYTGTRVEPSFYADETIADKYHPCGELPTWQDAAEVVLGHPHLETIVASAFAAPLVALSGYNGLVLSAFSPDSGVGKTTALKIAQSVWGAPEYMMQVNDTDNAVMKRVAEVKNLPIYYDELRMPEQLDKVANFVFQVVQGREKQRLNANSQATEVRSFRTMMVTCSNKSLTEVMTRANKTTRAGANRVLEFQVPLLTNSAYDMVEVTNRIARLDDNFGRAGEIYAQCLARDHAKIKNDITKEMASLRVALNMENEDRFWLGTMAVLIVAAKLAYEYMIIDLDADTIRQLMIDTYQMQKTHRSDNVVNVNRDVDVNELLSTFIREHTNKNLIVTDRIHREQGRPAPGTIKEHFPDTRMTNVFAQYAHKEEILRVDAREFHEYLHKKNYSPEVVISQLRKRDGFDKSRKRIASGTSFSTPGQVLAYDIPVPDVDIEITSSPGSSSLT